MLFEMKDAVSRLRKTLTQTGISSADSNQSSSSLNSSSSTNKDSKNNSKYEFDFDDDSLPKVILNGYLPSTKNRLLTPDMCDDIRMLMPTRIQLYTDWKLMYSLEQHGASLHSLYDSIAPDSDTPMRVGYVLVIKDRLSGIFGAYSNEPFHPTDARRYYGNGECFLWQMEKVPNVSIDRDTNIENNTKQDISDYRWRFKGYPYTGINEYAIYCTSKFLSMGAGDGHYGIWCDDSLIHGVSGPCLTFGNDTLSKEGDKFHIIGLEIWRVG
ncbi:hypothetical protein Kpol_1033p39 [Vanderwaltozyma polyspora DSM 70294]|uniref:Oxidation resistance protein 1 n=1 Tax=Vanderwaltozyma polyspora (strain ATCC 22028 / DSM 70294 / BCRC 21397 / CBS 2163 / NBRC 10782 / NRRL Y-8283 / UCD 57-17) TaxID=436907 RepID=A7TJ35_VANPO|nr:uncharacterized protein Kpol_1033p39 [Vanderwaltozyma polyspora DSM 70294]EDO17734.1 hypothetical protein Kpol_1033p39 [Vanderwaltozyma polyspora DSM 70294]